MTTPEASLPGITGLLDRVHSALRGIDAADTTTVIPDRQLDAVSDAVEQLESFCRRHGIALSEWAGRLPTVPSAVKSLLMAAQREGGKIPARPRWIAPEAFASAINGGLLEKLPRGYRITDAGRAIIANPVSP